MTKLELLDRLKDERIPHEHYSLEGGLHNGRLCMERKNNRWFVYYCKDGSKIGVKNFILEEVAYEYFYQELVKIAR